MQKLELIMNAIVIKVLILRSPDIKIKVRRMKRGSLSSKLRSRKKSSKKKLNKKIKSLRIRFA